VIIDKEKKSFKNEIKTVYNRIRRESDPLEQNIFKEKNDVDKYELFAEKCERPNVIKR
jgi:hypothetical protein